jgi:hypothetical protein
MVKFELGHYHTSEGNMRMSESKGAGLKDE